MSDPFESLRSEVVPVHPDPDFAEALRGRLQDAVLAPTRGTEMTGTDTATETDAAAMPYPGLTPYIGVRDARAAVEFYVDAFGARRRGEPIVMDDGRIGHVELAMGNGVLMMAEEFPEQGHVAPSDPTTRSHSLHLMVPDPDVAVARAVELGATLERPVADSPYGRTGVVIDPFGHRWMVQRAPEPAPLKHGDVVYLTHRVTDGVAAREFYGAVLGWEFTPGRVEDGWQIVGRNVHGGLWGAGQEAELQPMYQVDDLTVALDLVRAHGGTVISDPEQMPYGLSAECTDNLGVRFWLLQ